MRRRNWKTSVRLDKEGRPRSVYYRGRTYAVSAILNRWEWCGEWWAGLFPREYWVLELEGELVLEVYQLGFPDYIPNAQNPDPSYLREVYTWVVLRIYD
jgi:hypothetical protein